MRKRPFFFSKFFLSDKIFSKSREISRYPEKFPVFAVLTLLPGRTQTRQVKTKIESGSKKLNQRRAELAALDCSIIVDKNHHTNCQCDQEVEVKVT